MSYVSPAVVLFVSLLSGLTVGYTPAIISVALNGNVEGVKNGMMQDFGYGDNALLGGFVAGVILLGAAIGSLVAGKLAEKYGRRYSIIISALIVLAGTVLQAASPNIYFLFGFRFLLGAGTGIMSVVCPMYVNENAPERSKGMYGAGFQVAQTIGILISFCVGFGVLALEDLFETWMIWRVMVIFGAIFPIALLLLALFAVVETGTGHAGEQQPLVDSISDDLEGMYGIEDDEPDSLFSAGGLKYLLIGFILAATLQLTGINGVMYFGGNIVSSAGISNPFLVNIGLGGWNFLSTFVAVLLVDRLGRRKLMLIGNGLMCLALGAIAVAFQFLSPTLLLRKILALGGLLLFIFGFEVGPGCVFWLLANESFPVKLRESGSSYANLLQWGMNLIVSTTFLPLSDIVGFGSIYFGFAGVSIFCQILMFIFIKDQMN